MKRKWTFDILKVEALKYKTRTEFQKKNPRAHKAAYRMGILNQICLHMPKHVDQSGENNPAFKWTNDMLREEALKYKSRSEFKRCSSGAFQIAKKRGILDEICSHMPKRNTSRGENHYAFTWTYEMLYQEALKYKTRSEFQAKSRKAFDIAYRRGIMDEICSHMKRSAGTSKPEIELYTILKEHFPCLTKKSFPVNILNKPYIHRFQVDILNLETRLGIEFDGKYHHSEKYLIKSKTKLGWSIEDCINYHSIKDNALLDRYGISVLHIKEVDWNNNKQACIDKCLAFLGVEQKKAA